MLTIGSLFSGYAGLDMAVHAVLPARTIWHSDIKPAAVKLLAHHYPDIPNLGDITAIDWAAVERPDETVALLPTPTEARYGVAGRGDSSKPGHPVQGGPTAADAGGGRCDGRTHDPLGSEIRGIVAARAGASAVDWGIYAPAINRWATVLGRPAPPPTETGPNGGQRLSPLLTEWIMGLPLGHVTAVPDLSRNDMLSLCGDGVVPQEAVAGIRHLLAATESVRAA